MGKIGIMTFLHNGNYGSSLQAYALQRVVREMGYDCEHMDYRPDLREKAENLIRCGNSPKLLLEGQRKRQVQGSQEGMRAKHRAIDDFYARRMALSPVCRNRKELSRLSGRYDQLMCGSDQIWNPVWMNPAYFLDFGAPEKRRIAYAPSLGVSTAPGRRKSRMIRRALALFDAVSVREEEGARLLVTVTGDRPPVMPDPVCLLRKEEWLELAAPLPGREGRLLCYFIGENPEYWRRVLALSQEKGLTPLVIPVTAESYAQPFEKLDGAGPEAFLGAVAGAGMLCTDSFHGLAFGSIFGKPVDLLRRYRDTDRESKNSRVDHFLRETRSRGLERMRQEGLEWLSRNLEG
ncbi:MAG: polysaccharide pyruvyl transferase family protein [Clostridia bacterium]|nr:polysaccharide pyruvyl transferase family protein [Clostridia bacterium]